MSLLGIGTDRGSPQQAYPSDLGPFRQALLQLIMGGGGGGGGSPSAAGNRFGKLGSGSGGSDLRRAMGGRAGGGGGQNGLLALLGGIGGGQGMGLPVSDLQRGTSNSILNYLSQPAPEQRALDISMPALQAQLSGVPGGDVLDPLRAVSDRRLNEQLQQLGASVPGRFSTAAIYEQGRTRANSLQDFNLLASQIMEQGRSRQLQAAQTLGMLSGQAGQAPFGRQLAAGQLGTQQTGLMAQNQQFNQAQQLAALQFLLGPIMGQAFGGPMTQTASPFENLLGVAQSFAPFWGQQQDNQRTRSPGTPITSGSPGMG